MIVANAQDWLPTMLLQFAGDELQQLWITPLGEQQWRTVPKKDPNGFPETVVGHIDAKDES